MKEKTIHLKVKALNKNESYEKEEQIIVEYAIDLFLNKKFLTTLACSPEFLEELCVGYLKTQGIIDSFEEIKKIKIKENIAEIETIEKKEILEKKELIDNKFEKKINPNSIYDLMKKLLNYSQIFKETGGAHTVAIAKDKEILIAIEDVARHNALDKLIGKCMIENIQLKNTFLLLSGRVSVEMLQKASRANIGFVFSKSAPTTLSLELAKKLNIGLAGFIRGERMNIYNKSEWIDFK